MGLPTIDSLITRASGPALDAYFVSLRGALPVLLDRMAMLRLLEHLGRRREFAHVPEDRIWLAVARSERWARRLRFPDTCLYRSLVRWTALRQTGAAAVIVFGIGRQDPDRGHAWVELDGEAVGERMDPDLVETFRFPREGPAIQRR